MYRDVGIFCFRMESLRSFIFESYDFVFYENYNLFNKIFIHIPADLFRYKEDSFHNINLNVRGEIKKIQIILVGNRVVVQFI